jgi:hypothetical protein
MRQQTLRQAANRLLRSNRRGKYQNRKHRAYVIRKMIHDLYVIQKVPPSWQALKTEHIHSLVGYWKKERVNPETMMRYMTIIRRFLPQMDCQLTHIDNKTLQLVRTYKRKRSKKIIDPNIWQTIQEPDTRLIMALQVEFGLTFSEAIHIQSFLHVRDKELWVIRDIAFNSMDRIIPIRTENQRMILEQFNQYTEQHHMLVHMKTYDLIRLEWRNALTKHRLSPLKSWRYLYARKMYQILLPEYGNYKACLMIRDEMGIKSRNTLWLYLHRSQ